ncbi:MAG TPA: hypothetical protein VKE92_09740 [Anaerolineales bacterium]|nr:hypothetical protein [Anaerolineales bacterium]
MNKTPYIAACLIAMVAVVLNFQLVLAHESITVGDYEIEVGWVNEPPVAGQLNGIEMHVSNTSSGEHQPVEDISSLTVKVSYGGQSKALTLEPLGEDAPGQFQASLLPTIPGQYTLTFGGQLGDTPVDAHLEPEEVAPADTIQFPRSYPAPQSSAPAPGVADWLVWLSLLIGLVGMGLGVTALRKK